MIINDSLEVERISEKTVETSDTADMTAKPASHGKAFLSRHVFSG
jgi:phage FluMu protein gp41